MYGMKVKKGESRMKRTRYEKLMRALSVKIGEKHGYTVTGDLLRKQRSNVAKTARELYGSYQLAWDHFKNVRDAYGMN